MAEGSTGKKHTKKNNKRNKMSEVSVEAIKRSFAKGSRKGPAQKKRKTTKKKKSEGINAFFLTVTNSQGFGLHLCRYEQSIGDHVYVPPKYGQLSKNGSTKGNVKKFCIWCKLQPCIVVEYWDTEMRKKVVEEHLAMDEARKAGKKKSNLAVINKLARYMTKYFRKIFGSEYTNRVGTPHCIMNELYDWNHEWNKAEEVIQQERTSSSNDSEEDNESEDDKDGEEEEEFA